MDTSASDVARAYATRWRAMDYDDTGDTTVDEPITVYLTSPDGEDTEHSV